MLSHSPKSEFKGLMGKFNGQRKNIIPILVALFFFIALLIMFLSLISHPSALFTVSIPLILGAGLFFACMVLLSQWKEPVS